MLHDAALVNNDALCGPSAGGIRHCLRMLADEAAQLQLSATVSAIEAALRTCLAEAHRHD